MQFEVGRVRATCVVDFKSPHLDIEEAYGPPHRILFNAPFNDLVLAVVIKRSLKDVLKLAGTAIRLACKDFLYCPSTSMCGSKADLLRRVVSIEP